MCRLNENKIKELDIINSSNRAKGINIWYDASLHIILD